MIKGEVMDKKSKLTRKGKNNDYVNPVPFTGELRVYSPEVALSMARRDCSGCMSNYKMAKKVKWRCVVNLTNGDIVAIMK